MLREQNQSLKQQVADMRISLSQAQADVASALQVVPFLPTCIQTLAVTGVCTHVVVVMFDAPSLCSTTFSLLSMEQRDGSQM